MANETKSLDYSVRMRYIDLEGWQELTDQFWASSEDQQDPSPNGFALQKRWRTASFKGHCMDARF
jgi:hypothetical protein